MILSLSCNSGTGFQHHAQAFLQSVCGRHVIGNGPGRADAGAGPMPGTDIGVDKDMIAVGADRRCRAGIQATGASGLAVA